MYGESKTPLDVPLAIKDLKILFRSRIKALKKEWEKERINYKTQIKTKPQETKQTIPLPNQFPMSEDLATQLMFDDHEREEDYFPCQRLCKKAKGCNNPERDSLGFVKENNCFLTRFPKCPYQLWIKKMPYGNPEYPYPICTDPKPPRTIPKAWQKHGILDPQFCWDCLSIIREKEKDKAETKPRKSYDPYKGEPRVNWGDSKGFSLFDLGDR